MKTNKPERKPYGSAYQRRAVQVALEAGCKGNEMGILYCLFTKIDYGTGQTQALAHKDLGSDMGGLSFDTVRKCIGNLRKAGVIKYADYRGKGVKWGDGSGHANRYQMALPVSDPVEKTHRGVGENSTIPPGKNTHHFKNPSLPDGNEDTPSRREGDKVPDPSRKEELQLLSQWTSQHGYSTASRMIEDWRSNQQVAAE